VRPDEKGGGILADEMGMGKSLSTLALILRTVEEGRTWALNEEKPDLDSHVGLHTHCTLIVVPSARKCRRFPHLSHAKMKP
jgi:SWI/SNF-related matrix-associated actin-dependent regulator of chromatin subfamily A3